MIKKYCNLSIKTPIKSLIYKKCQLIKCYSINGNFTIYPSHESYISLLKMSKLLIVKENETIIFYISNNTILIYENSNSICNLITKTLIE